MLLTIGKYSMLWDLECFKKSPGAEWAGHLLKQCWLVFDQILQSFDYSSKLPFLYDQSSPLWFSLNIRYTGAYFVTISPRKVNNVDYFCDSEFKITYLIPRRKKKIFHDMIFKPKLDSSSSFVLPRTFQYHVAKSDEPPIKSRFAKEHLGITVNNLVVSNIRLKMPFTPWNALKKGWF